MKKRIDEEQEEMPRWDLEDLSEAVATLKRGGLILYPTDTIWGIGCDATNAEAVSRIFALKQRDDAKALLSIVSSDGMLAKWYQILRQKGMESFMPSEEEEKED